MKKNSRENLKTKSPVEGVSLERSAVFMEGDVVMRRPPPFAWPKVSDECASPFPKETHDETGLVLKAGPMKKHGVGGAQTTYDAQELQVLWASGKIEDRTTVFNNLMLVDPNTGLPENVHVNGGWENRK